MYKKYKIGLLIGRFQPFHKGHLWLIRHALRSINSLIIGIGSANIYDGQNPFSFQERNRMIEAVIKQERLEDRIIKIVPLDDFYNDEKWFRNILTTIVGKINVVIGNNEWTNRIFEERGYKILRVGYYKRFIYEGEKIRKLIKYAYHKRPLRIGKGWEKRVPKYIVSLLHGYIVKKNSLTICPFNHIALGGTFDHFHKGHEKLIDTALKYGATVSIGITRESMYKHKEFPGAIESFQERKRSVITYLKNKKSLGRVTFYPLSDIYGTTKIDGTIEAIIVSRLTYPNAIKINIVRKVKKLPELKIICIKDVKGDDGKLISSERIRKGEIDREGKNFLPIQSGFNFQKKQLILPEYLREELRKPLGKVIKGKEYELEKTANKIVGAIFKSPKKPTMVIAVGDIIYISLIKAGFIADVGIIDYRSRRAIIGEKSKIKNQISKLHIKNQKEVKNQSGTISKHAFDAISSSIKDCMKTKEKQLIVVDGEEDLLALPAILLAPLNSVVLYGQMDFGVVVVTVTEQMKGKIKKTLKKFN